MTFGVVGLGLIGGSIAKALYALEGAKVYAFDSDRTTLDRAFLQNAVSKELTEKNIGECDYIFLALYPGDVISYIQKYGKYISKNAVALDCSGTKRKVCEKCFDIAEKYGFHFIGGHPMAGTQFSGFKYSRASMFANSKMLIIPSKDEKIEVLQSLKDVLLKIGFKGITITTPQEHDRIIAFTSQLAHVVSNAYVKSPNAKVHDGFSAGSYRDLTRVARLNSKMWTELFLENADNLTFEIDRLISELQKYSDAIKKGDEKLLFDLLEEGTRLKESID